ncbi:MAG: Hsp70 family protein [Deltaproteobacteria bacterium]|nr:Hsp70 family protein [Deltaproteobacteria bacterium]
MSDADELTYTIGVDLGTTHCAVAAVDHDLSEGEEIALEVLRVPQSIAPGEVEARDLLPSFLYLPHESELPAGATALPWSPTPAHLVGELARQLGGKTPGRLVSSAKSWLSHSGVDRRGAILPVDGPEGERRLSPVDASVQYLAHLREAWDAAHPEAPFAAQEVVLTVPASFDPAARELTAEAAKSAGYENLTLLEEPQAALYSWVQSTGGDWREKLSVGDVILVVDVGGGTTDFSLIAVEERDGSLGLERIAVGNHILLGGDNMDLALAYTVKAKLEGEGKTVEDWQVRGIVQGCRQAKEALLAGTAESVPIVVPSRGRKLIGGSLRTELTRAEVEAVVLDGFFPVVDVTDHPASRARGALTQLGLPYAQDAGVTRHLAAFLSRHVDGDGTFRHPTALLWNGGVLKAPAIAERLTRVMSQWLEKDGAPAARLLEGPDLDRAVARGAAYYGYARRGGGVRIRGGLAQAYYVGVETAQPAVPGMAPPVHAVCVAPFGLEEGQEASLLPQELGLVVGEPVRFRFFGSSVRRDDETGTMLQRWSDDELLELGAIEATLPADDRPAGDIVPVRLGARVTEVGTLVLEARPREGERRWNVELSLRDDG